MDATGRRLARGRLDEGVAGISRLHAMVAKALGEDVEQAVVKVGIETDRGPWVQALLASGYEVFAVNPLQAARYRQRHSVSGATSDKTDAHTLANMVRTDSHELRAVTPDSPRAEAIKVVARAHKTLIWERTRHTQRLYHALREYFPAALRAFDDLDAVDTLELLGKAPDPASAARLSISQISAALKHAHRRHVADKARAIQVLLRTAQLAQPTAVVKAYAATVRATVAVLVTIGEQVAVLQAQVEAHFGQHPAAEIILSQPGLGPILGARVLGEFGDAQGRYASAKARKNYAATSPITRQSGKKKAVLARFVHNDRLADALGGMFEDQHRLPRSHGLASHQPDLTTPLDFPRPSLSHARAPEASTCSARRREPRTNDVDTDKRRRTLPDEERPANPNKPSHLDP